jgi:hypothetical protein
VSVSNKHTVSIFRAEVTKLGSGQPIYGSEEGRLTEGANQGQGKGGKGLKQQEVFKQVTEREAGYGVDTEGREEMVLPRAYEMVSYSW